MAAAVAAVAVGAAMLASRPDAPEAAAGTGTRAAASGGGGAAPTVPLQTGTTVTRAPAEPTGERDPDAATTSATVPAQQRLAVPAPGSTAPVPTSTVPPGAAPPSAAPDWEALARSVVQLVAPGCQQSGSGTIIGDGRLVLTNSHVLHADGDAPVCEVHVGFARRFDAAPDDWQRAELVADDPVRDLAVVRFSGTPADLPTPLVVERDELALGDDITILGYPGFGQSQDTLTFTSGTFSGTTTSPEGHRLLKTDALLDSGVSGGAVFDRHGHLIGVATGLFEGEGGSLGVAIPGTDVLRFLVENGVSVETSAHVASE
ncbi:S1 family peptidase [Candidatus Poriferisodalis sp.]|uniref:S1 family peptidase n=1 Tax=Candidatus Poriferisodalis sp. TaxID=3101277 RepID=UPI003AF98E62